MMMNQKVFKLAAAYLIYAGSIICLNPLSGYASYFNGSWGLESGSYSRGNSRWGYSSSLSLEFDAKKRLNSNFRIAVRENRLEYAQNLLERGADVNSGSERRETALMYAAKNCSEKAIRFLLRSKANVNAQDVQGRTALMLAARESCVPGVMLLLRSRGIITEAKDHLGNRAEDYALRGAVIEVDGAENEIVRLLRKSGQNPIHRYTEG